MKIVLAILLVLARGPDDARKKSAGEHFQRGQKLYAAEKFEQALEEFKAGYATYPLPGFLINIGQSYRQLGERKKAITLYQQYLDLQPEDDSLRPQVEKMIADLEREERVSEEAAAPPKVVARPAKVDLAPKPPAEPPPAAIPKHEEPEPQADDSPWYGKWWVWTLAGVLVAGGVAAGVAASSSSSSGGGGVQPGSLGLLDGRR
jgi:tetratricopeptide (TPR) repeat protein